MNNCPRPVAVLAGLLLSVCAGGAEAQVWSDDKLASRASGVVIGEVTTLRTGPDTRTQSPRSLVTVRVDEVLKGPISQGELVLTQPIDAAGPAFAAGERVLLFLAIRRDDGAISTLDGWQGKWTIDASQPVADAVRFDPEMQARGAFRGVGERRALGQLAERVRIPPSAPAQDVAFATEPSADELRQAVHGAGAAITRPPASVSGAVEPSAPSGLTSSVSGSTVTLTWRPVAGPVTSYVIEVGSAPGLSNLARFASIDLQVSTSGVAPGSYYVRVRAVNADGTSAPSNEVIVTVGGGCQPPTAASNLRTISVTGSTVVLQWNESPLAYSYLLEAGAAPGLSNIVATDLGSNLPGFTTTNVPAGTYYLRVRAKNPCGVSAASNEIVVSVGLGSPQGNLVYSFSSNPARVAPPYYCSAGYAGPQWSTQVRVTNTSDVGVTVTSFSSSRPGTLNPAYGGNGRSFSIAFEACDLMRNAGSAYIPAGEQRCLRGSYARNYGEYCPVAVERSLEVIWTIAGTDDRGRALGSSSTLLLPLWSPSGSSASAVSRPAASPTRFETLLKR